MQDQSIALFCTKGGADKTYQIHLRAVAGGFDVTGYNGRRGGTLTAQPKTPTPLTYEAALKVYQDLLKRKLKDGYVKGEGGTVYQEASADLVQTGIDVQLLTADSESNAAEVEQAERLAA